MKVILAVIFLLIISGFTALLLKTKVQNAFRKSFLVFLIIVFFALFVIVPFGFGTIQTGEIGVVKQFGRIKGVKQPGLYWVFYPITNVEIYDTKVQQIDIVTAAYSQDSQTMDAELTIQFRIQTDKVEDINSEFGDLKTLSQRIEAVSTERLKVVLSSKSAMALIETRSTLSSEVEAQTRDHIQKYYVEIISASVTDIAFNSAFETAVENKMIAEQDKLKAEYDKEKAIIKAEEELEVAKRAADAKIEEARGNAQSLVEIATAEAESIKLKSVEVARMLGFTINEDGSIDMAGKTSAEIKVISDYLQYIEYLSIWDGKLPEVMAGDSQLIIPVPSGN
jgi:regulator of protease activity HflC (stomatin/prohibitin superfamily)